MTGMIPIINSSIKFDSKKDLLIFHPPRSQISFSVVVFFRNSSGVS